MAPWNSVWRHWLHLRLVGVQTPKGYCFFLTNLPPRVGPRQVADLYRVRWEVELSMRLDQSVQRLEEIDAEPSCSLKALLHASRMVSTIAAVLAHRHHLNTCPKQVGAPRTEAPLHTSLLALQLAVSCHTIAQAFDLQGAEAKQCWAKIADLLTHSGKDPNWHRRPSVLDQLRGWKRQPVTRDKNRHRPQIAAEVDTDAGLSLELSAGGSTEGGARGIRRAGDHQPVGPALQSPARRAGPPPHAPRVAPGAEGRSHRQRRHTASARWRTWAVHQPRGQALPRHRRGGGHRLPVRFSQAHVATAPESNGPDPL